MELSGFHKKEIQLSPEAVEEVNQKISELKDTLDKHGVFIVFNLEIGKGFLFPKTYKVCDIDDPDYDDVNSDDSPMSIDGVETKIGSCLEMYDYKFHSIIPA